jgi:hypothetical protein
MYLVAVAATGEPVSVLAAQVIDFPIELLDIPCQKSLCNQGLPLRPLYSDEKSCYRDIRMALRDREWLLNDGQIQNPSAQRLDSGTIYSHAEGFGICPSFKDHFLSRRANPDITIRNFFIAVPSWILTDPLYNIGPGAAGPGAQAAHRDPHQRRRPRLPQERALRHAAAAGRDRTRAAGQAARHQPPLSARCVLQVRRPATSPPSPLGACCRSGGPPPAPPLRSVHCFAAGVPRLLP